jgi:hypothetical protein
VTAEQHVERAAHAGFLRARPDAEAGAVEHPACVGGEPLQGR